MKYNYNAIFGLSLNRLKQCGAPIVNDVVTRDFKVVISDCGRIQDGDKNVWNVSWEVYIDGELVGSNMYQY